MRKILLVVSSLILVLAATRAAAANTVVRIQTDLGSLDIELFDAITPITVTNFLNYVNDGDYEGTFFHRVLDDFVVQGGGFVYDGPENSFFAGGTSEIPTDDPIVNEFNLSNTRGTIAMAKLPDDPDSATSQWFFNLTDNSENLDNQNGGFTVFAKVLGDGMDVIDAIAGLPVCSEVFLPFACGQFVDTPTVDPNAIFRTNDALVNVNYIGIDADGDGVIDFLEDAAPSGGDGNNDTIADSTQQYVASFPGAAGDYITLSVPATAAISDLDILGRSYLLFSTPRARCEINGLEFRHGHAGFRVAGIAAGSTLAIDILLPPGQTPDAYYRFGVVPGETAAKWQEFPFDAVSVTGAQISANTVTLYVVDGGRGDADLVQNGAVEVAPGGPAFTVPPVDLDDDDCDGLLDSVEDGAPNGGDGNGDGVPDSAQVNIASLTDIRDNYVTVAAPPGIFLDTLRITQGSNFLQQADPASQLNGLNFAHGFLEFGVSNTVQGGSADIRIILPEGEAPVTYYKYGPTPDNPVNHLYEFLYDGQTGAEINGNIVTLHFVDGERGDSDLVANGVIADPGAPALAAEIAGAAGGSGGGCTVANEDHRPEQAVTWWLLLGLLCLLGIRRQGAWSMPGR